MKSDVELLTKINKAVAAANEAEKAATTARDELVSRSRAVGLLLLEAKKLHPAVKDFEAFLARVDGLKLSRAYDLLRLAGGRTTEDEIRKDTRERVKKHRAKKIPKPAPSLPKPEPVSVTKPDVTESPKPKAEQKTFNSPQEAREQAGAALRAAIAALVEQSKRHIHFENALSPDAFSKADIDRLVGQLQSYSKFQKCKREAA